MDKQARCHALTAAYGSPEIRYLYKERRQTLADFLNSEHAVDEVSPARSNL
ncbi:hypothetical protein [Catenuloplanes japonicus]|uniref:hypothetical protein n=1 Tax=Catenuloplanes japonicus TaxID=33876 RepID=UPI0012F9682B|nr:hypothetical protein [Catenuloplanes japonicus]